MTLNTFYDIYQLFKANKHIFMSYMINVYMSPRVDKFIYVPLLPVGKNNIVDVLIF